jgi:uncharacterized protein YkwD
MKNFQFITLLITLSVLHIITGCKENPASSIGSGHKYELEKEVHRLINLHRTGIGLPELEWSEIIAEECRLHSIGMADSQNINHNGFYERIDRIKENISLGWAGENVAFNWSPQSAVTSWLDSPGHRNNIESNSNLTGVGVAFDTDSAMYFTQIFVRSSE